MIEPEDREIVEDMLAELISEYNAVVEIRDEASDMLDTLQRKIDAWNAYCPNSAVGRMAPPDIKTRIYYLERAVPARRGLRQNMAALAGLVMPVVAGCTELQCSCVMIWGAASVR